MAIADDWTIDYDNKAIRHFQADGTSPIAEDSTVTVVGVSGNITTSGVGDYFNLYSAKDETAYYVWYNVTNGTTTDPAPQGKTEIQVDVLTSSDANAVATATRSAINTVAGDDFTASGTAADVDIVNENPGSCTDVVNGVGLNEFTYTINTQGQGETVWALNALYSYLMDIFDESAQMDDTLPMTSQTPTEYTLVNNWFIDETSIKYLKGGALQTSGWDATSENNGVRVLQFGATYYNAVAGDIGDEVGYVGGTPSDTGTLLYYNNTLKKWWVRVDDTGDTFANTSTEIDIANAGTGTGGGILSAASATGESLWANVFTLGTLEDNTDIYVIQNGSKITSWWPSGHIDILVLVKEADSEIDIGRMSIYARQYSKLYDYFDLDATAGGRNPIPLATSADIDNTTGIRTFTGSGGNSNTFEDGNYIYVGASWATATKKGVLTADATGATPVIIYYLAGDVTQDFAASDAVKEYDPATGANGDATTTAGAPSNYSGGPAAVTGVTIVFGSTSQDIGDGDGNQPYDVLIDCGGYHLDDFYEYTKYLTRRGNSGDIDTGGQTLTGEQYISTGTIKINYDGETGGPFTQGETLTGTDASAVLTSLVDNGLDGTMVLRDVRGTFEDNLHLTGDSSSAEADVVGTPADILVVKTAPFGTFAGGQFFGARGVWITNMHAEDANSYQLIDSNNVSRTPPTSISISVNGVAAGDRVSVFRATGAGGTVNKSVYTIFETHTSPVAYIRIAGSAPLDTPATGIIHVVRRLSGNIQGEERYSYTAWTDNTTYTEFTISGTTTEDYDTNDTAYVPYIEEEATGTSVSVSVQFVETRDVVTVVRRKGILPFRLAGGQITSGGYSAAAIRTADTIVD